MCLQTIDQQRIVRIAHEKAVRINGEINCPEVRLVGIEGEPIGIVSISEAMRMAEEAEIDLVEICIRLRITQRRIRAWPRAPIAPDL